MSKLRSRPYPKYCLIDDDMREIYAMLESCDGLVLGSPVYFDTVTAQTKLMMDRCNCLMPYVERADGTLGFERRMKRRKNGVLVAVAGIDQELGTILTTVRGFFNWANAELNKTIFYCHDHNELGRVKDDKKLMNQAFEAGVQIAEQASRSGPARTCTQTGSGPTTQLSKPHFYKDESLNLYRATNNPKPGDLSNSAC
jgi:multimeric flavodoxin WrbA